MPDIRSFFGPKGGAAPTKLTPKKEEEVSKRGRSKARKVVDDSEEDEEEVATKKPAKKASSKAKASEPKTVKGVETSASSYFASKSQSLKPQSTPQPAAKNKPRPDVEVRVSPRRRQPAPKPTTEPSKASANVEKKKATAAYKHHHDNDGDAYMEDADEDADDIFAADTKGRKRQSDDYEEESEDEVVHKPKRIASRSIKPANEQKIDEDVKPTARKAAYNGKSSAGRKRKSLECDEDGEEDEEDAKPRKRAAPAKPRAPRAKKEAPPESTEIQQILDNVPTIDAPEAPPKDPNVKFDWRKGAGNANTGPPPMEGALEIPEGEENCLMGKSFVFTGQLKTIAREAAQELVKRYGGKVTGAPSSKTDFVVLGDDAGPSKLRKIQEHGIKTIDEVGLCYLIKTLPANGGSGQSAGKAKKKQDFEDKKVKEQAAEMEREEQARRIEAEKAQKTASARGVTGPKPSEPLAQLWTTKYAPSQLSHICGNKANVERIQNWLKGWSKARKYEFQKRGADGMGGYRAIIISGPPGIGKTTAAHLAAKLEGFDVLESNASDTRSKKLVETGVSEVVNNTSLLGYFAGDGKKVDTGKKNIVLIMDEVDGMSAGDRGGVGALAKFCKKTEVPLILICNDRRLPKMKPFDHVAFDIKFQRPTVDQIRSRIMTICHREGLRLPVNVVNSLIEGSNKDIRQMINMISTAKLDQEAMDFNQSKQMTKSWEKHVVLKPWDICQKMLGGGLFSPASTATLNDKIELYFNDHEFSYLMIQENYLSTKPSALSGKGYHPKEHNLKYLELVDEAAESISDGDLVDRMIHGPQQHWSLMPTHAVFSTVRPASLVSGQMMGSTFTSWLGNNSKYGKLGRFVREIHSHMRLKSSGDHHEIRQQYLPVLWYQLLKRLEVEGKDCIEGVIELMDSYYLTRDDFDAIKELGVGPQSEELTTIETQTKAAFTRTYNAMSHPVPFMKASSIADPKKVRKDVPDLEEAIEEEDEGEVVEAAETIEDMDMDIKGDKYIKQPKAKANGKKTAKKAAKDADEEDGEDSQPVKGRGKGKGAGRGRPAKK